MNKEKYISPRAEVIELNLENTIMNGSGFGAGSQTGPTINDESSAPRRSFWE